MTSGSKHFEDIAPSRFLKHRSGLRRSPSIYQTFETGDSVEKAFGAERYWLLIGDGVRRGGVSDGRAVDDQFHAAIPLTAVGSVIRGHRLRFSKAPRDNGRCGNSLLCEKIAYRIRAALGELLIEVIRAHAIGVAFNLQSQARMRK